MQQARDRPDLTLLHLGAEQRLDVADLGLSLARGGLRQPGELAETVVVARWARDSLSAAAWTSLWVSTPVMKSVGVAMVTANISRPVTRA